MEQKDENVDPQEDIIEDVDVEEVEALVSSEQSESEDPVSDAVMKEAKGKKESDEEDEEEPEGDDESDDDDDDECNEDVNESKDKKLDKVGDEDDDVDNDGDEDASDEYLKNRRKVVAKAIADREKEGKTESEKDEDDNKKESIDFSNIQKLVEDEENLSEGFKTKAALIFKTEVDAKVSEVEERLSEEYNEKMENELAEAVETLTSNIDEYLSYAVENWMKDNEVAIESSLRTGLAENFIGQLRTLFTENFIEVPEAKVDLFTKIEDELSEAKTNLQKSEEIVEGLAAKVDRLEREKILSEESEGLVKTQASKLATMAEGVEFDSPEQFRSKLGTLKEFYFGQKQNIVEEVEEEEVDSATYSTSTETIIESDNSQEELSPTMQSYLKAMSHLKRTSVDGK